MSLEVGTGISSVESARFVLFCFVLSVESSSSPKKESVVGGFFTDN